MNSVGPSNDHFEQNVRGCCTIKWLVRKDILRASGQINFLGGSIYGTRWKMLATPSQHWWRPLYWLQQPLLSIAVGRLWNTLARTLGALPAGWSGLNAGTTHASQTLPGTDCREPSGMVEMLYILAAKSVDALQLSRSTQAVTRKTNLNWKNNSTQAHSW